MNNKLVYIIIPIYNAEKYINKCLDSVLNQTYKNIFLICINDGSSDKSLEILNTYKSNNIHIINKNNEGPSVARNEGLNYLFKINNTDSYLTFLDSDDFIEQNYIETLVNHLESYDVDIICSGYILDWGNHYKAIVDTSENKVMSNFNATLELLADRTIQSHSPCKLYKTSVWMNVRYPINIVAMEDQATIFKTFLNAHKVGVINYAGYHYRQDSESICRSEITNKRVIDSCHGYMEACTYEYKDLVRDEVIAYKNIAKQALAAVYLMMVPHFNKKKASEKEREEFKQIKRYMRKNNIIGKFIPHNRKERLKKTVYIFLKPFYSSLFRYYLKMNH